MGNDQSKIERLTRAGDGIQNLLKSGDVLDLLRMVEEPSAKTRALGLGEWDRPVPMPVLRTQGVGNLARNSRGEYVVESAFVEESMRPMASKLSRSLAALDAVRNALAENVGVVQMEEDAAWEDGGERPPCYGCTKAFVGDVLDLIRSMAFSRRKSREKFVASGLVSELITNNIRRGDGDVSTARDIVRVLTIGNSVAAAEVCKACFEKLLFVIDHCVEYPGVGEIAKTEIMLLSDTLLWSCNPESVLSWKNENIDLWKERMSFVVALLIKAAALGETVQDIHEHITKGCLTILTKFACIPFFKTITENLGIDADGIYGNVRYSKKEPKDKDAKETTSFIDRGMSPHQEHSFEWQMLEALFTVIMRSTEKKDATEIQTIIKEIDMSGITPYLEYLCGHVKIAQGLFDESAHDSDMEAPHSLMSVPVMKSLLLCPYSESVRLRYAAFLILMIMINTDLLTPVLDSLIALVPTAVQAPVGSGVEVFTVLRFLCLFPKVRHIIIASPLFDSLFAIISTEAARISRLERRANPLSTSNMLQGRSLVLLTELFATLCQSPRAMDRLKDEEKAACILSACLTCKGLTVMKSYFTDKSAEFLFNVLMRAFRDNTDSFMHCCSRILCAAAASRNIRTSATIVQQICGIIVPPAKDPEYQVVVKVVRSQREYFEGSVGDRPMSSKEVGPLFKDVMSFVRSSHNMPLGDDPAMEFLVDGKIISNDLSIRQVYEQIWKPNHKGSNDPMLMFYRLTGVDGEATEERVDELEDPNKPTKEQTENKQRLTSMVVDGGCFASLGKLMDMINPGNMMSCISFLSSACQLMSLCCEFPENATKLSSAGLLPVLLRRIHGLMLYLVVDKDDAVPMRILNLLESMMDCAATIAKQSKLGQTLVQTSSATDGADMLTVLLDALYSPRFASNKRLTGDLKTIIPIVACFQGPLSIRRLIDFYSEFFNMEAFNRAESQDESSAKLDDFVSIVESSPAMLKDCMVTSQQTQKIARHLLELYRDNAGWNELTLAKPSLLKTMNVLKALVADHPQTQRALCDIGLVAPLHRLESMPNSKVGEAGIVAQLILDLSATNCPEVKRVRDVTKEEKRKKAMEKRKKTLGRLNANSTKKIDTAISELKDETGLVCNSCGEGFVMRPNQAHGIYTLIQPFVSHSIAMTTISPSAENAKAIRSVRAPLVVTRFQGIHPVCHFNATRAERGKKQPLEEWEAARIRNSFVMCNSILPVFQSGVDVGEYNSAAERFLSVLRHKCGEPKPTTLLLQSVKFAIQRMVYEVACPHIFSLKGLDASKDYREPAEAGGRLTNMKLAVYLLQFIALSNNPAFSFAPRDTDLVSRMQNWMSVEKINEGLPDNTLFALAMSLVGMSLNEWKTLLPKFVSRAMSYASFEYWARTNSPIPPEKLFNESKHVIIFLCVVNRLQHIIKKDIPTAVEFSDVLCANAFAIASQMDALVKQVDEEYVHYGSFDEFAGELGVDASAFVVPH